MDCAAAPRLQNTPRIFLASFARPSAMEDAAVNRLAMSITQLTLCQVTTEEVDAATKLLDKACQKLHGIPDVPSQRITDLEATIRQMRQLSCILDSCTISASYEVSQAQKAILLMPRTAKGASTSSEELNAQISPRTDEEHNLPAHEDYWQECKNLNEPSTQLSEFQILFAPLTNRSHKAQNQVS